MEEAKLEELRAKHGEIDAYPAPDGRVIVITVPGRAELKRFMDRAIDGKGSKVAAIQEFVRSCIVYPEPAEAAAILDR